MWTIPKVTGHKFPPCAGFTINVLSGNKAVLFGGVCTDDKEQGQLTSDVFILSVAKNSVVSCPYNALNLFS